MVKQFQETKETIWLAITFPGCFTFIRTKPKDGDDLDYCHIRFIGPLDQPGLIYGSNTCSLPPPKLRQRRRPLGTGRHRSYWKTDIRHGYAKLCHLQKRDSGIKWHQQAELSRSFSLIPGIFPSETVPLPELLEHLKTADGKWNYFYVQEPKVIVAGEGKEL